MVRIQYSIFWSIHPSLSSSFCFSSSFFFSSFPVKTPKSLLAKFCHFPLLKFYQRLKAFKLTKSTFSSFLDIAHRPYHSLIAGAPPLLIKPTLWPPFCLSSLSSCNPISFPNHPNQRKCLKQRQVSPFSFLLIQIFPINPLIVHLLMIHTESHQPSSIIRSSDVVSNTSNLKPC